MEENEWRKTTEKQTETKQQFLLAQKEAKRGIKNGIYML